MDYKAYRAEKQILSRDMIVALRDAYPRYGKPTQCMIENPDKYGVCLTPAAENVLASRFGPAKIESAPQERPAVHRKPNRKKAHRLTVRLADEAYGEVKRLMDVCEYKSDQEFLEDLIWHWTVQERTKRIPDHADLL